MSSPKEVIVSAVGAKPIGPYSPAIRHGNFLFTSGQIGLDPATAKLVPGGVEAEARQALTNLASLLEAGGSSFDKVLKTTLFLTDMADFAKVNAVYAEFFGAEPPARSTVAVRALPGGALVEVESIALV